MILMLIAPEVVTHLVAYAGLLLWTGILAVGILYGLFGGVIKYIKIAFFDELYVRDVAVGIEVELYDVVTIDTHVTRYVDTTDTVEYLLGDTAHHFLVVEDVLLFTGAQLPKGLTIGIFDVGE